LGSYEETTVAFALARYLPDGSPDLGFGEPAANSAPDGQVLSLLSPRMSCALELALWSDGRIAVAGQAIKKETISDFGLAVYTRNGVLDSSFGGPPYGPLPGTLTPDAGGYNNGAISVGVQRDGKPVVVGRRIFAKQGPGFGAFRYDDAGAADPSFHFPLDGAGLGHAGKLWLATEAEARAIQSDGKLTIAGMDADAIALIRLAADGSLDHDFGAGIAGSAGGIVVTALGAKGWPTATALAQRDQIVVAGGIEDGGAGIGVLLRYTQAGDPDVTFGKQGVVMAPKQVSAWRDIAVADDGKLLAVSGYSLVRFMPDGSLDLEFGDSGSVTNDFPVSEVALGPDGKIVVAGMISEKGSWSFALARFWP
jgi:uncharacterized delta-60 repeat protein